MIAAALVAALAAALSCDSPKGTDNTDAAVNDTTTTEAADVTAASVWSEAATKLLAENRGGGLAPQGPAGSECQLRQAIYTLTVADRKLTWRLCPTGNFDQPFRWVDGEKILDPGELSSLVSALNDVTVSSRTECGSDKPTLALRITTPAGERQYVDDFYACVPLGTPVDNIDGVFDMLALLR